MANKKISELNNATTPLAGTEEVAIVQGGETKKVAVGDIDLQVYKTITGNTTLDNSFHSAIVLVKANATITIPAGLRSDFNCVGSSYSGVTAPFTTSGGATIDAESDGTTLNESKMFSLFVDGTDNYILRGTE